MIGENIRYVRWFKCNDIGSEEDFLTIEVSGNGGGSWTPIEVVSTGSTQWVEQEVRLSEIMTPGQSVTVRFSVEDCLNDSVTEAAIDEFSVSVLSCEPGPVPTVSEWGFGVMTLLLLMSGTIVLRCRRAPAG